MKKHEENNRMPEDVNFFRRCINNLQFYSIFRRIFLKPSIRIFYLVPSRFIYFRDIFREGFAVIKKNEGKNGRKRYRFRFCDLKSLRNNTGSADLLRHARKVDRGQGQRKGRGEKKDRIGRWSEGYDEVKGQRDDIAMECESNCFLAAEIRRLGKVRWSESTSEFLI